MQIKMGNGGKWKAQSKRTSTKLRVKVEKKVKEHHRKLKREKKKNPGKFRKSTKDPGVPGNCPFKEQVLSEAREIVQKRQEEKEKRRTELRELRKHGNHNKAHLQGQTLESLLAGAQQKAAMFEKGKDVEQAATEKGLSDRSAKAFYKEFRKVVEVADVVLQVLDARDPLGSRCREVEEAVVAGGRAGKRLVLVLNKADLVPRDNLQAWIKHLRNEYPTIAFKASTQQTTKLGHAKINMKQCELTNNTKCVGADTLLALLGNYCRNKDIKTSIRVGVVGMPNVGKSSLINSLKRSKACNVGATPGVTKSMQEVRLDSKVKLLDSPGLVMAGGNRNDASVALRNAVKVESLEDPITPVLAILARVPRNHLMMQYNIGAFQDCSEFLALLAGQMGKLKRGGVPDREKAARIVLGDWNTGKIKYYTHPPEQAEANLKAEIVAQFTEEFSLDQLDQIEEMDALPTIMPSDVVQVTPGSIVENAATAEDEKEDDEEEEEMEDEDAADLNPIEENEENLLPKRMEIMPTKKKAKDVKLDAEKAMDAEEQALFKLKGNQKLKKAMKLQQKKIKKDAKRSDKLAMGLSDKMEAAFSSIVAEDYDVNADYED